MHHGSSARSDAMKKTVAIIALVLSVTLFGCGKPETKKDAPEPTAENILNGDRTQVIRMPDGFRNVVFSCYGTVGIYVTSRGAFETGGGTKDIQLQTIPSAIAVLPGDPHCKR